jgi:hypothetical protein
MKNNHIGIIITSYKDKNLADFVKTLKANTITRHSIEVFEQHPIAHHKDFDNVIEACSYEHNIWDDIGGPTVKKTAKIAHRMDGVDYICVMTPDTILSPGWDVELINFINNKKVVVSGKGILKLSHINLFSIGAEYHKSETFNKVQFVDHNFIFASSDLFKNIVLPDFLKYYGENEYWTLSFMSQGYEIFSAPESIYKDTKYRSIENTYHTFSSEHNYNIVVDILHKKNIADYKITEESIDEFFRFHVLEPEKIHRLPYQTNDVLYHPYDLKMHEVDARRFISGTKAVY